jgi:hypothetical protein
MARRTETVTSLDSLSEADLMALVGWVGAGGRVEPEVLAGLCASEWVEARLAAASRDDTPGAAKVPLADDPATEVRRALAIGAYPSSVFSILVRDRDREVGRRVICNHRTPIGTLVDARQYVGDKGLRDWIEGVLHDRLVRSLVDEALESGLSDGDGVAALAERRLGELGEWSAVARDVHGYRSAVPLAEVIAEQWHSRQSAERSREMAKAQRDVEVAVYERLHEVMEDPQADPEVLRQYAMSSSPDERYVAGVHPRTPTDAWGELRADPDPTVRSGVRTSSHADGRFLTESLRSTDPASVSGALCNKKAPLREVGEVARHHPDEDLRTMAADIYTHRLGTSIAQDIRGMAGGAELSPAVFQDLVIGAVVKALGDDIEGPAFGPESVQELTESVFARVLDGMDDAAPMATESTGPSAEIVALRPRM